MSSENGKLQLTLREQIIWKRIVHKANKKRMSVSYKFNKNITVEERLEMFRALEESVDAGEKIKISLNKNKKLNCKYS